ncbi:calpain catalytic domain-containing protein [Favolaschia claudopus]|uniref:Calpain catalytic domain-containing protein n=1 Tax=Favolaschia claudopus TaxID=2862362 RepID=A0AAW0B0B3_9AGAR
MPASFFKLFTRDIALGLDFEELLNPTGQQTLSPLPKEVSSPSVGLLSTPELESVIQECKATVARIVKQCKARNVRYRDPDFDLGNDRGKCLHGVVVTEAYTPSDIQRVTELFGNPQFFSDSPYSNEMIQGQCSNCWFISAMAATSTVKGLVEKYCVARDEKIGVYGFVFWRDVQWVSVIIDDVLYTSVPKYEELSTAEKTLFQNDKDKYNASARKGTHTLYFSKSGKVGETWVSLLEKAYAKLHGDYAALSLGFGVEDLTGTERFPTHQIFPLNQDILDHDRFWEEEILKAGRDRIIACSFQSLNSTRNGEPNATISGLQSRHSYSVLKALEYKGKRFLVIRNPSGRTGWDGRWADGSKEWTAEWLDVLPLLGHAFGDSGKFIMEYQDFLSCFAQIDRTRLFDSTWTMRYEVLRVPSRPFPLSGFGYGDICFPFSLSKATPVMIVLAQLDVRYYKGVSSPFTLDIDFALFRKGEKQPLDFSDHSPDVARSISLEFAELEEGEYIVHCRMDPIPLTDGANLIAPWTDHKTSHVITNQATSESVAASIIIEDNLPIPLEILAGQDLAGLASKASNLKMKRNIADGINADAAMLPNLMRPDLVAQQDEDLALKPNDFHHDSNSSKTITTITTIRGPTTLTTDTREIVFFGPAGDIKNDDDTTIPGDVPPPPLPKPPSRPPSPAPTNFTPVQADNSNMSFFLGLKVYTPKDVTVLIEGQLRHDLRKNFEGLQLADWRYLSI